MLSFNRPNNDFNLKLIIHIIKKLAHLGELWAAFSLTWSPQHCAAQHPHCHLAPPACPIQGHFIGLVVRKVIIFYDLWWSFSTGASGIPVTAATLGRQEKLDMQEQRDCKSKNSNLPHYLCCPCSAHQYRELKCHTVCSFTQISCIGLSSQFLFYSHQLLLCPAGCYPAEAECIQFFQSALNDLMVNGLMIQKSLKRTTTDIYQTSEAGNFVKFLLSETQCLYRGDILTSEDIKHLA